MGSFERSRQSRGQSHACHDHCAGNARDVRRPRLHLTAHAGHRQPRRKSLRVAIGAFRVATALAAARLPSPRFNRVVGLNPAKTASLQDILAWYAERPCQRPQRHRSDAWRCGRPHVRYEIPLFNRCRPLSDYEWTAIKPMLPNKPRGIRRVNDRRVLNGIFWSSVQVRLGVTCQRPMVPVPLVTIASFVGGGLAYGTRSWMRWPPVMTRQCR
jgi:hypothetical protein